MVPGIILTVTTEGFDSPKVDQILDMSCESGKM